ncbi:MAG: toprim domain-containing protein [Clostridia bacterium]
MLKIKEAIIVEGKYDKMRLSRICDALIITTDGFRIFKDNDKREFLKALAKRQGLLILTDSDRAGFVIRSHLKSFIPSEYIKNIYIPDIKGKEKRKEKPSKEGLLGVEGMEEETLKRLLESCSVNLKEDKGDPITKADLYEAGLSGSEGSSILRQRLISDLSLPSRLSTNSLLEILNATYSKDEFFEYVKNII